MSKRQLLRITYWVFFAAALIAFYIGLRYDEQKMLYTLVALGLWGISYLINQQIKKAE